MGYQVSKLAYFLPCIAIALCFSVATHADGWWPLIETVFIVFNLWALNKMIDTDREYAYSIGWSRGFSSKHVRGQ